MALKDKESRTIVLNISESTYSSFMEDRTIAHKIIQTACRSHPELFPEEMAEGYWLNGKTRVSKKLDLQMRKIKIGEVSYRLRPSFILPYQRGKTDEAAKPLFLLRFGVPFWALAYVFGRNTMWWYRTFLSLGFTNIVGTSVYNIDQLPQDLLADEHHIRIRGKKAYVATTIGGNCFLGVEASFQADEASLSQAYGVFKQEVQELKPDYEPATVNTDGWWPTQNAWKSLFPSIAVMECFLHAYLKVRDRTTKKLAVFFDTAADKIWKCYFADTKRQCAQRIRRLSEWAQRTMPDCPMKDNIFKLCGKKNRWLSHFDFDSPHRTSNMLDRIMRIMDRHAFNAQMFHATVHSTSKNFRALALLYNFSPSCPAVTQKYPGLDSPAARLNGFVYKQDCWLQNLMIASSLGGNLNHRNPV